MDENEIEKLLSQFDEHILDYLDFVHENYDGNINIDTIRDYFHGHLGMKWLTEEQLDMFFMLIIDYLETEEDYTQVDEDGNPISDDDWGDWEDDETEDEDD